MTTVASWIADTRDHLDGGRSEEGNQVDTDYIAGSGQLSLRWPLKSVSTGSLLSVGMNTLRVLSVNSLSQTVGVVGGYNGSTDSNQPAGTLVRVNPRFTDFRIFRALNQHLGALSSPTVGLFRVGVLELDYVQWVQGYPLAAAGFQRVLEVRRQTFGPSLSWPVVNDWSLISSSPAELGGGVALRVGEGDSGRKVQVVYAGDFLTLSDVADDSSQSGLPDTASDIPPLGAAIRLMSGREVSRNAPNSQGDTRRAEEVPQGAVLRSYAGLIDLWQQRTHQEATRLRALYPVGR